MADHLLDVLQVATDDGDMLDGEAIVGQPVDDGLGFGVAVSGGDPSPCRAIGGLNLHGDFLPVVLG